MVAPVVVLAQFGSNVASLLRDPACEWDLWPVRHALQLFGTIPALGLAIALAGGTIGLLDRLRLTAIADRLFLMTVGWAHSFVRRLARSKGVL